MFMIITFQCSRRAFMCDGECWRYASVADGGGGGGGIVTSMMMKMTMMMTMIIMTAVVFVIILIIIAIIRCCCCQRHHHHHHRHYHYHSLCQSLGAAQCFRNAVVGNSFSNFVIRLSLDGILALGKAHTCSVLSLSSQPKIDLEAFSVFMGLVRLRRVERRPLPFPPICPTGDQFCDALACFCSESSLRLSVPLPSKVCAKGILLFQHATHWPPVLPSVSFRHTGRHSAWTTHT